MAEERAKGRERETEPVAPARGTGERFGSVISRYAPRLLRFLELRTGNRSDAQDLAQEAYLRLCRVPDGDLILKPESYLFRIAFNLSNEFMLRRNTQPSNLAETEQDGDEGPGDEGRYCSELEHRSEIQLLERAIAELPPLYQAVLLLRKRDGYSHEEIAMRLSISPHTVHKYLTRALLQCRMILERKSNDARHVEPSDR